MIIREGNNRDIKNIVKLNVELNTMEKNWYPYPILNFKKTGKELRKNFSRKDSKIFVAIDHNKIVGYVIGWIKVRKLSHIKKCGYCSDLFVLKEYRRRGLGTKLIRKFEEWCKKKGIRYLELDTHVNNRVGKVFYPSCGFKEYLISYTKKLR